MQLKHKWQRCRTQAKMCTAHRLRRGVYAVEIPISQPTSVCMQGMHNVRAVYVFVCMLTIRARKPSTEWKASTFDSHRPFLHNLLYLVAVRRYVLHYTQLPIPYLGYLILFCRFDLRRRGEFVVVLDECMIFILLLLWVGISDAVAIHPLYTNRRTKRNAYTRKLTHFAEIGFVENERWYRTIF